MDEVSGLISLSDYIDREVTDSYILSLRAVDLGFPQFTATAELNITVEDVNDRVPSFDFETYSVSLSELSGVGTSVVTVGASDNDIGTNANLTYSIIAGDPGEIFTVNPHTGEVLLNGSLDFETTPTYSLTLLVSDQGQPEAKTDTSFLTVWIVDENEHTPFYLQSSYHVDLPENTPPGSVVGDFGAADGDVYLQHAHSYSLIEGANASLFKEA